ncbi:hypothetical protein [Pedosphaera parvula]|uniref:Uncharacterized protein n=1 Tax=Pedosphaera parvula (strain Ellin514) TaxID=320771 RepID=B9XT01_PEDPL|nr:hypothetical protein [Pedosphaera parvula]EEF57036.1 hypothetical protein Cflav_PD0082 [Pedosphaera parvula Ellin514]
MTAKFTIDGSDALEAHLAHTCSGILAGVRSIIPAAELEALVLGGGYGRGQGGVFKTDSGDRPYNDLEFYVFIRGNVLVTERKYRHPLNELGDKLSPAAGLHVEFKVYSVEKLKRTPVSMFTYDLVAGHRIICGDMEIFKSCSHHLAADQIPLYEATRLLVNRCSGLLLAKDFLRNSSLSGEQNDFIVRNIAKAQLAFGDALLTAFGKYHWSCTERHHRLGKLFASESLPRSEDILKHHALGVEFKLHPKFIHVTHESLDQLHHEISRLGQQVWLWNESRRLHHPFISAKDYAMACLNKCPETVPWKNSLLNLRTFGPPGILNSQAFRYPRERLMNALALLLWEDDCLTDSQLKARVQQQLRASSAGWTNVLGSYKTIWQNYG